MYHESPEHRAICYDIYAYTHAMCYTDVYMCRNADCNYAITAPDGEFCGRRMLHALRIEITRTMVDTSEGKETVEVNTRVEVQRSDVTTAGSSDINAFDTQIINRVVYCDICKERLEGESLIEG